MKISRIITALIVTALLSMAFSACFKQGDVQTENSPQAPENPNPEEPNDGATKPEKLPSWANDLPANAHLFQVTWPATSTINQQALAMLAPQDRIAVETSHVPVLVPGDANLMEGKDESLTIEKYWYSYSVRKNGIYLNIGGGRVGYEFPNVQEAPANSTGMVGTKRKIHIEEGEVGWTARWEEDGSAYHASIGCEANDDARCKDGNELIKIIENAVYIGGLGKEE